jgi:Ni/Co efflux regulator RcnB
MKNYLFAALATALLVPSAAMATSGAGSAHDQRAQAPARTVVVVHDRAPSPKPAAWHRAAPVHMLKVGTRLEPVYLAKSYKIAHPARYHLARADAHERWVRVHDHAVLVNVKSGRIAAVRYHLFA